MERSICALVVLEVGGSWEVQLDIFKMPVLLGQGYTNVETFKKIS